jgi:hypothetical protein
VPASIRFANGRKEPLDVYVEPWPERFRLQPGEELEIRAGAGSGDDDWLRVEAHEEGITLWADVGHEPEYLIDGKPARWRSWSD